LTLACVLLLLYTKWRGVDLKFYYILIVICMNWTNLAYKLWCVCLVVLNDSTNNDLLLVDDIIIIFWLLKLVWALLEYLRLLHASIFCRLNQLLTRILFIDLLVWRRWPWPCKLSCLIRVVSHFAVLSRIYVRGIDVAGIWKIILVLSLCFVHFHQVLFTVRA
jgi:hypothetical protein